MDVNDMRTEEGKSLDFSFYVYDDLLAQKKRTDHTIYRFDTLDEAIAKFNELPGDMRTVIGFSDNSKPSELDLIRRIEGEPVLAREFLYVKDTKMDPRIYEMATELCDKLHVMWEQDAMFGNSILVPREFGVAPEYGSGTHNSYFDDKRLDYLVRDELLGIRIPSKGGPKTAIEEVYLQDEGNYGYVPFKDFIEMVNDSENGYLNDHRPKVGTFYINYVDSKGHFGGADVNPHTMRELLEREKCLEQDFSMWRQTDKAVESLAGDLDDFVYDFDFYTYQDDSLYLPEGGLDREGNIQKIIDDLRRGDVNGYRSFLREIASCEDGSPWGLIAREVLNKMDVIYSEKAKSLDRMIEGADFEKEAGPTDVVQNHKREEKGRE